MLARRLGVAAWLSLTERARFEEIETYCMFIGTGRSGHSLVGSLLDAHPEAVIAHELDALRYFRVGFPSKLVYGMILQNDREFTGGGRQARLDYAYAVPHQWQGRYRRLRVIGDKKGGGSTRRLREQPDLIDKVRERVGSRLRVVQVSRNPFDTIATMYRRTNRELTLADKADHFLSLCETIDRVSAGLAGDEKIELRHEDLLADPKMFLSELCRFLGLDAFDDYLDDCAGILFAAPRQTRGDAPWTPELIRRVDDAISRFSFLAGYSFDAALP